MQSHRNSLIVNALVFEFGVRWSPDVREFCIDFEVQFESFDFEPNPILTQGGRMIEVGQAKTETLSSAECIELLKSACIGRLVVNGARCPQVFPVNYAVDASSLTFRAKEEIRAEAVAHALVTFQADGYDTDRDFAWSVMAHGAVEEMRNPGTIEPPVGFAAPETEVWTSGPHPYWLRIVPQILTGSISIPRVVLLD